MNTPEYLDFDLKLESDGQGGCIAQVQSPAGEARTPFTLPFSEAQLERSLSDLKRALAHSSGTRAVLTPEEQTVQDFGKRLFNALFRDDVRARYDTARAQATQVGKHIRLRLRVSEELPLLATLPWEFLFDPRLGDFICLAQDTPFVRYLETIHSLLPTLRVEPPLRILGMIAAPTDQDDLRVDRERENIETALREMHKAGLIHLEWLPTSTWDGLQEAMLDAPWHVFHFIGHGGFNPRRDEGVLAFENERRLTDEIGARELGRILIGNQTLRFVFLNSCMGAASSERDIFSSTAAALVRRGIPAVLAMQYEITDSAAIAFSKRFYEMLVQGYSIDAALTAGRLAITRTRRVSLEWGTPVLHTRTSGALFDVTQPSPPAPLPHAVEGKKPPVGTTPASSVPLTPEPQGGPVRKPEPPPVDPRQQTYEQAMAFYDAERYEEALPLMEALVKAGYKARVIAPLIKEAQDTLTAQRETQKQADEEQQRREAEAARLRAAEERFADLEALVKRARTESTLAEARTELTGFLKDFPEYQDEPQVAALREKLKPPPPPAPPKPRITSEQEKLLAMMLDANRPPKERAEAGQKINQLPGGDPRPGVLDFNWGEDYWCLVSQGEFQMGSEKESDNPKRLVKIDYDFWIGKYPITWAQWKLFLEAKDGYQNPDWWKDLHKDGRNQQQKGAGQQRFKFDNHPAENVSWYEAMAFCKWLNALTPHPSLPSPSRTRRSGEGSGGEDYQIRLPLETEWEKAASWDAKAKKAREYPWGDGYKVGYANIDETLGNIGPHYLQTTTAVGIYPQGVSPYGALDMSGNVWEWCLNEYGSGQVNIGSNEARVLRGGSWLSLDNRARAAYRSHGNANSQNNNWGFRLALS